MKLKFVTPVAQNYLKVKAGFTQDLFLSLAPPWAKVELKQFDGCKVGDEIHVEIKRPPLTINWVSLITKEETTDREWIFVDEGKKTPWPITHWRHLHRVIKITEDETHIVDDIEYSCSSPLLEKMIYPTMWATFAVRPSRFKEFFKG